MDERDAERGPLTQNEADARLGNRPLVAALEGSLPEMKQLRDQCLAVGIPAQVGCPGGGAVTSWGTRTHLLVQEESLSGLAALMHSRWQADLGREGLTPIVATAGEGEDPPCPACGTAAPLVEGACSDCGLVLE